MTTNQFQTNAIPVDLSRKHMERRRQSTVVHNQGFRQEGITCPRLFQFGLVDPRLCRDPLVRHASELRYLFTVIA
ncbi:hypothetical protein N9B17_01475 [Rhodopirellula sp.]|nr:hypothetical protein [Rhodopirellula sp.]